MTNNTAPRPSDMPWHNPAPYARKLAISLYGWRDPRSAFLLASAAALVFAICALLAPALLSLSPTVELLSPIASARAILQNDASIVDQHSPFYLFLIMAADVFADKPGRVLLIAKALGAVLAVLPLAHFLSSRMPFAPTILLGAAVSAYVTAPFSGPAELGLAILLACAICFTAGCADQCAGRARWEGVIAGFLLYALWLMSPVYSLISIVLLSVCPYLSGAFGLSRYTATLATCALLAAITEFLVPGLNLARAAAANGVLNMDFVLSGAAAGASGIGAATTSLAVIFVSAAVFGGREHLKNWIGAGAVALVAAFAAKLAGADNLPIFVFAAMMVSFSTTSPFYDGVFRNHDRASIATALTVACLSYFWAGALTANAVGQFSMQAQVAKSTPADVRSALAVVHPGGHSIARWVEEGRFSTPEARRLFSLTPIDQSMMLVEAASRARTLSNSGYDVAILTGIDTACVLENERPCRQDGVDAVSAANIVLVPRLDLDAATAEAKGRAEATLITEFHLSAKSALWEIWVRRGAAIPADLLGRAHTNVTY